MGLRQGPLDSGLDHTERGRRGDTQLLWSLPLAALLPEDWHVGLCAGDNALQLGGDTVRLPAGHLFGRPQAISSHPSRRAIRLGQFVRGLSIPDAVDSLPAAISQSLGIARPLADRCSPGAGHRLRRRNAVYRLGGANALIETSHRTKSSFLEIAPAPAARNPRGASW